ncbi:peptidoglycan recognition protein family protein [Paenibacillus kobensis]|uniref:peptidoglycan recognition protein family protein n=1 Tax=Paenibacillus kobensis TaxID=59841 RepID=UPI0013E3F7F6|nr:peptidoglycan recognition family protein [Paenibacillus kobensis]
MKFGLPYDVPPIEDITDQLPKHPTKTWGRRKFDEVENLIVHHMASEAPLANQAKYHITAHDWPGIAYSLCVDGNRLVQTNDLLAYTTHARGANHNSIGISIRGDLSKRSMTTVERQMLYAGILLVKSIWPNIKIKAHNEVSATSCPCTDINLIRAEVAELALHIEEQQQYEQTLSATRIQAYAAAERVQALYDHYNDPRWSVAAEIKLMWLAEITGYNTPKDIAERVLWLYQEAQGGKFQNEAVRKLLLIADVMKQRGLL